MVSLHGGGPTLRLFLAGVLPAELQADVFHAISAARRAATQARWVRPGQLHLTVAFFGETEDGDVPPLREALGEVAKRHHGLRFELRGAGCFGRPHQPEVLFAELQGDVEGLRALVADVQKATAALCPPPKEKRGHAFRPHLTLARAKGRHGDAALSRCLRALKELPFGAFSLERLVLFHSELTSGGPVHTPLADFALAAGG